MNYWAVGAAWGSTEDVSKEFINKGIWYDGYAENNDDMRYQKKWKDVRSGDLLIMKSRGNKGQSNSISFTRIKAIGNVIEKIKPHYFKVDWWYVPKQYIDVEGVWYPKTIEPIRNDSLKNEIQKIESKMEFNKLSDLLKTHYQIILQGAPGTGKTHLAKQIAQYMTKPSKIGNIDEKVNSFFENFDSSDPEVQEKRKENDRLLKQFYEKFPKENLKSLNLDNYPIGTGSKDSFCWWIDKGLKSLGNYFPVSSRAFLIYWSKDKNTFSTHFKHSSYLSEAKSTEEAMERLAGRIHDFVVNEDISKVYSIFGWSLILKILHSYYPDKYFPINSRRYLDSALKLLGIETKENDYIEKNKKLQNYFEQKRKEFDVDITNLEFMKFLMDELKVSGNIEVQESEAVVKGQYKIIQFHPAYTYEDFVRGIVVETDENQQINYVVRNKTLVEFAEQALENPSANFILIIDEINRANLPSVLGELIYALEYRYDENDPLGTSVESMYSIDSEEDNETEGKIIKLPKNLFLIGTMNTADRSVGHIDYAIRRRFAFVDVHPKRSVIGTEKGQKLFDQVARLFCNEYSEGEENPEPSEYLSPEFKPLDVMIGHSYFMGDEEKLLSRLQYEIKPILNEYLKDGVLQTNAEQEIKQIGL